MLKVIQASNGKITAAAFRSAMQYGRVAALGWDESFIAGPLGRMIQEYTTSGGGGGGAGGPGNALMSMNQALIPGRMTKEAAAAWAGIGFNNMKGQGLTQEEGRDLAQTNPYEWVQKYLMPALAAKGITDQNAIIGKISELFGIRTAAGIVSNMALGGSYHLPGVNAEGAPNSPFEKDIALQKVAEGKGAYGRLIKEDYPMIMEAFNKQWENLLQIIGGQLMAPGGPVISALSGLVGALSSINNFFAEHPKVVDGLLIALAGLAAAFAAFAVSAAITVMTMLAPGGLIVVAIAGLVASLVTLAAVNWDKLKVAADGIVYFTNIMGTAMRMLGLLPKLPKGAEGVNPNIHPQRYDSVPDSGPRLLPANFNPGSEKKPVLLRLTTNLNVDGHLLATAVSEGLEDLYEHPTNAPQASGWDHFRPAGNFSDT
jgi:hypothetical protein